MSQTTTVILLPQTAYNVINKSSFIGQKQPAAGYHQGSRNLQTMTWKLTGFSGILRIQASLSETPTEADWFEVYKIDAVPGPLTQTSFHNLTGNFVWLRASINLFTGGVIQHLKVSY
jgi:hypothetical protein